MTNTEIIRKAAEAHGFTLAQLDELAHAFNGDLPFHTYAEWKSRGYHVKRGEKAIFAVELWKYTSKPSKAQQDAQAETTEGETPEEAAGHYFKKLSHIFSAAQVERDDAPKASAQGKPAPAPKAGAQDEPAPAKWTRCDFYTLHSDAKGKPAAVLVHGYTDGTYNFYRPDDSKSWHAIHPYCGLSVAQGRNKKAVTEAVTAVSPRVAAAMGNPSETIKRAVKMIHAAQNA